MAPLGGVSISKSKHFDFPTWVSFIFSLVCFSVYLVLLHAI